jgi:hypothetical protein
VTDLDAVVIERIFSAPVEVVWSHVGIPSDSPGAMGWNMAFDKLVRRLGS